MAGFQKFPIPKYIYTRAFWPTAPNWKANSIMIGISVMLTSFTLWRYSLIRTVIIKYNLASQPRGW